VASTSSISGNQKSGIFINSLGAARTVAQGNYIGLVPGAAQRSRAHISSVSPVEAQ
jgi:hypothetical protein